MNQKQILKQMIDFNRTTFNNTFNTGTLIQDQIERMANTVLDQATWIPAEGRDAIDNWVEAYKSGLGNYKSYIDESYRKVEEFINRQMS